MNKLFKTAVFAAFSVGMFSVSVKADPFEDFKKQIIGNGQQAAEGLLKPFAADFGGLLGGADFNSGRTLGFPGFDVGIAATVQAKPSADNKLLKNAGVDAFGIPLVQASVALPLVGVDVAARGFALYGLSILGAGVRIPVLRSDTAITMFIPDVSVSAFYDAISYDYFKGSHVSVDAVASFDIPFVKPYIGVGIDRTKLEVKDVSTSLNGVDATISKPRYTVGLRISPVPLLYVYGAYSSLHGQKGYQAGAGVRF